MAMLYNYYSFFNPPLLIGCTFAAIKHNYNFINIKLKLTFDIFGERETINMRNSKTCFDGQIVFSIANIFIHLYELYELFFTV